MQSNAEEARPPAAVEWEDFKVGGARNVAERATERYTKEWALRPRLSAVEGRAKDQGWPCGQAGPRNGRLLESDRPWSKERLALVEDRVRNRLQQLSNRLGDADWLGGAFSAGDLMMVSVLLRSRASRILDECPNLTGYVARGEARPAYKRAFDAQLAVYAGKPPTG